MVDASSLSNSCIKMSVSVIMITYNHEAYIAEAIEGVLMQEVDFPVELIIADDCSPDDTATIVQEFINNHPKGSWIKYTRHSQNKGMMPNFIWALEQAKGNYIALCEGDDFWTDSYKLQKQVGFLEANEDYSGCAHNVTIQYEDPFDRPILFTEQDLSTIEDVSQYFYPTCSLLFRKSCLGKSDMKLFSLGVFGGDKILLYILFKHGKLICLATNMAVYRKNKNGVSYSRKINLADIQGDVRLYNQLKPYFINKYDNHFNQLALNSQVRVNNYFRMNKKFISFLLGMIKGFKYVGTKQHLKLLIKDSFIEKL
jgi:glycosyltransferase involved in cell wall biosynthesis